MKLIVVILFLITGGFYGRTQEHTMSAQLTSAKKYYYLALGDSYTIGEMVAPEDNFPNQVYHLMKNDAVDFQPPRIIAKTGWTTDELEEGIIAAGLMEPFRPAYDFVSLLIGVNNQYRGRSPGNYKTEFEALLKKALAFSGNRASNVIVLSIPDWGVTAFAEGRDRAQIAAEIDSFNTANKQITEQYRVHYADITSWTRESATDHSLLAQDGLHPSAKEYKRWAELITVLFKEQIR